MAMLVTTGVRPVIDTTMPLARAADGFAKIVAGDTAGKIVITV
jgi:NADPH:quinone reductase-like Zn-dependent oxidoreductase